MPVVAVNLGANVFADIRSMVERGLYASPEQFLEIAAFNQLALERGVTPSEVVARGHRKANVSAAAGDTGATHPPPARPSPERRERHSAPVRTNRERVASVSPKEIRALVERLGTVNVKEPPTPVKATPRPASERVYGLVNRIFPLKLAARCLGALHSGGRRWSKYDAISEVLAADAAVLGSALETIDTAAERKRDELLSTGLPRKGNIASCDRFLTQYIARTTRKGDIYPGAICQYALAQFDGERLCLTDRGLQLALLTNPILDHEMSHARQTLSDEECLFLAEHVRQFVPGEQHDFRVILGAISSGAATPDQLLASVRSSFPEARTDLAARSYVSGLVARLTEMGALHRQWEGRNVRYELTERSTALNTIPGGGGE